LAARVRDLSRWLRDIGDRYSLLDISFTLSAGRSHFGRRIAFAVQDVDQLREQLDRYLKEDFSAIQPKERRDDSPEDQGEQLIRQLAASWGEPVKSDRQKHMMMDLAQWYSDGLDADWRALFEQNDARRISMPVYPFAAERYWRPDPIEKEAADQQTIRRRIELDRDVVLETGAGLNHLPGLAFLEAARLTAETFTGGPVGYMTKPVWGRPLLWRASPPICFVDMRRLPGGDVAFEVNNGRKGGHCRVFAQGKFPANGIGGNGRMLDIKPKVLPPFENLKNKEKDCLETEHLRYVRHIQRNGAEAVARLTVPPGWSYLANGLMESLTVLGGDEVEPAAPPLFPLSLETVRFKGVPEGNVWLHISRRDGENAGFGPGHYDISVFSEADECVAFFEDLAIRPDKRASQPETREGV
jgi:hypothetical protein